MLFFGGHGEEVRLSGNVAALGFNDPKDALPMVTTSDEYPWWRVEKGMCNVN